MNQMTYELVCFILCLQFKTNETEDLVLEWTETSSD